MYSSYGSYNPPPAELSNNPFLEHSSNPLTRYPDVGSFTSSTNPQFTPWIGQSNGIPQQQGYNTYGPQPTQQQYTGGWGGSPTYQTQGLGYPYPQQTGSGIRFQPSSSFGQQLSSAVESGGLVQGGLGYQQQPQQQFGGMPGQIQIPPTPYQQTGITGPGYLSEFDPYAATGQGSWDGQQQPQQQSYGTQNGGLTNGGALNSQPDLHPREVIRKYKTELEAWDTYAWKQLMNSLESLKKAWEKRMYELDVRMKQVSTGWSAVAQHELAQYKNVLKDAELSFSSVAASSYQLEEVLDGYRQSADMASKRRVREAMNAALRSLPEYPPSNY
ncbi:hypothetical protein BDM02DRAFT_3156722 [Thelephora ganbajun]|uniref:Uncharacterized protein n=1 Tax=Thelephora ganbajun TaxID=370292 RepID=A0ACB6Z8P4_THEGA|nr:hypothetical protein BDM02DRAFT_3156722 [Thelephora ganbajun]